MGVRTLATDGKALVVCGVLKNEIAAILERNRLPVPVVRLAPAPCIDQRMLRRQLENALRQASSQARDVLLVIGRCHPDIEEIAAQFGARRLHMNDCFEALLGREERQRLDREANTFYTLASWLPHWRRALSNGMRWDEAEARHQFARYDRVLLLDTGLRPIDDEQVLELFDFVGVPVEIQAVGLESLASVLIEAFEGVV